MLIKSKHKIQAPEPIPYDAARRFAFLSKQAKLHFVRTKCDDARALTIKYTWAAWARDKQLWQVEAAWDWQTWLLLSGRGFGKTRTGSEWTIEQAWDDPAGHIALVARTAADVRDVMVGGRSGILACSPPWFMPEYEPSKRRLTWPNGCIATTYTAEKPDQLRGPGHTKAWGDERAAWQYDDAWDQLQFGLREGAKPQCVVTSTPRATKAIKALAADPGTHVTCGNTYENRINLAPKFIREIERRYGGTRLGRQEIEGHIIDDIEGALWKRDWIENYRVLAHPDLKRIVVAIDPPAASDITSESPAEAGICVAGLGTDGHGYMLADYSLIGTPDEWASAGIAAYSLFEADLVVGEVNNGGDMVEAVIQSIAREKKMKHVNFKAVRATRGKQLRAEPVSSLYQRGQVHHVGTFPDTEDQQCLRADTLIATEFGQVRIDQVKIGDRVWTSKGLRRVIHAGCTSPSAEVYQLTTSDNRSLVATVCHPVYTLSRGFVPLGELREDDILEIASWENTESQLHGTDTSTPSIRGDTRDIHAVSYSIEQFGKRLMALYHQAWKFITEMRTQATLPWKIWRCLPMLNICESITPAKALLFGIPTLTEPNVVKHGRDASHVISFVHTAKQYSNRRACVQSSVVAPAPRNSTGGRTITTITKLTNPEPVYNIQVEDEPEYYANGIRVHNCNWCPGDKSPDRLDANVWAFTELMVGSELSAQQALTEVKERQEAKVAVKEQIRKQQNEWYW